MKKSQLNHIYCILIFVGFLSIPIYRVISTPSHIYDTPTLIAHAGGSINGHKYTNSYEAIINSIKTGFLAFELDFALSSDSILVALHDWKSFKGYTNHSFENDRLSFAQFSKLKLHDKYTPMSQILIDSIMNSNPHLILVTDKISNPEIINHYFSQYKNRIKIECFTLSDYFKLKELGYDGVAYSGISFELLISELKYLFCISNKRVTNLVLSNSAYIKYRKIIRWWCTPKSISLWGRQYKSDYDYQSDVESIN